MCAKIDIFISGEYICSTNSSRNLKEAKEKFLKNPYYMGLGGIRKAPDGIVSCAWAEKK